MPMYEFVCQACKKPFEKLLRMSQADDQQVCPQCGGQQTHRQLSRIAFNSSAKETSTPVRPANSPFT